MKLDTADGKHVEVDVHFEQTGRRYSLLVYSKTEGGAVTYLSEAEVWELIEGLREVLR